MASQCLCILNKCFLAPVIAIDCLEDRLVLCVQCPEKVTLTFNQHLDQFVNYVYLMYFKTNFKMNTLQYRKF